MLKYRETLHKNLGRETLKVILNSGLDIVRRDWSQFAADAGKTIIDIIMTDKSEDARLSQIQVSLLKHCHHSAL